ncbi:penicillin-binding protein activator [Candidatus Pacearchaeota archaeon]|nr:penicillin-binding protein activator [Candidatus Pacearchaeota archaeon]
MANKVNQAQLWVGIIILIIAVIGLVVIYSGNIQTRTSGARIGVIIPLTGDAASYGASVKKGLELAKKELGLELELIFEDSKCDEAEAVNSINKLISSDKVNAIIGELCSGATLAAAPIAEQNNIVLISPGATSPDITSAGEYLFRTVPSDSFQGKFGAEIVYHRYGKRNLAILYSNENYDIGFNQVLKENFEKLGGKVVASEAFERNAVELRAQLTKIKNANPDAIYIISNEQDSAVAALKQIKELKIDTLIFGSEGLKGQYILDDAKDSAEGLIVISASSGTSGFIDKYKTKYDEEPGAFAAQGYDALQALSIALEQGAQTGEEIRDRLYELSFEGASGRIDFDNNGDVSGIYEIYKVKNGEFVREN